MDRWGDYPLNLPGSSVLPGSGAGLRVQMDQMEDDLFSDEIRVRVRDIHRDSKSPNTPPTCVSALHTEESSLEDALKDKRKPRVRIISIFSASTIEPLQISRELLLKALTRYNVPADFLSIVISFGDDPHLSEGSSSNMSIVGSVDSDQSISYQINYVEENDRKGEDPWSRRHTGVFHHHGSKESIWILLFPTQEKYCKVESQLRQLEAGTSDAQAVLEAIITNPLRLHMFLFSSYFENWRWYLRKLGEDFAYINNLAMTIEPKLATEANLSFVKVQALRNIHDNLLSAKAFCQGNLNIATALAAVRDVPRETSQDVQSHQSKLKACIESSEVLQGRVQNAIGLLGYAVNLQSQQEATLVEKQLSNMIAEVRDLAAKADKDNVTITIITLLSAFYLPGSFIGTLFGMNFFDFDDATNGIVVGRNVWIFLVFWIPLTVLTYAAYILLRWANAKIDGKVFDWPWTQARNIWKSWMATRALNISKV